MKLRMSALMIAAVLAGCSQGGSDNKGGGPSNTVNSKVSPSAAKALSGQAALFEASSTHQGGRTSVTLDSISKTPDSKSVKQRKAQKVTSILRPGSGCQVEFSANQPVGGDGKQTQQTGGPGMMQFRPMTLTTKAGCPVEISLKMELDGGASAGCSNPSSGDGCRFKGKIVMKYHVKDQKLANELEVSRGMIGMSFDIDQNLLGGASTGSDFSMALKNSMSFEMQTVALDGSTYALKGSQMMNLKVDTKMPQGAGEMPQQNMTGGAKEEFHYVDEATGQRSDLLATLTANGASGVETFVVDGVNVTAEAYMTERQKLESAMMVFGGSTQSSPDNSSGSDPDEQKPTPAPGPQPGPGPVPAPQPQPAPNPAPAPIPNPAPVNERWVCVNENSYDNLLYMGYGATELMANTKGKQACQAGGRPSYCQTQGKCEERSATPSWFCEVSNSYSDLSFSAHGNSRLEAAYFAYKACAEQGRPSYCTSTDNATCGRY